MQSIKYKRNLFARIEQHGGQCEEEPVQLPAMRGSRHTVPSPAAVATPERPQSSEEALLRTVSVGRAQPRKLAEMELLSLKQISAMSGTDTVPLPVPVFA